MSVYAIETALWRATRDPEDAKRLLEDAHAYLGEFRIDEDERWLVAGWDLKALVDRGVNPMVLMMAYAAVNGPAAAPGYPKRLHQEDSFFPGRFAGQVAVVTGAAQGIGYEVARRLGREGASIVVADAAEGPTAEAVKSLQRLNIAAVGAVGDLSCLQGAEAAMARAQDAFGRLDILVNNVGGAIWMKPFWHFSEAEMRAEVERSFWPTLNCCRASVAHFRAAGGGVIVNVGSNAATDGVYRIPYSACKGAVVSLTRSLAVELACLDIRVNCVSPGGTTGLGRKTPRSDAELDDQETRWLRQFIQLVGREELIAGHASAEEQAAVIAFLASREAGHITGEIVETGRRGQRIAEVLGQVPW